LAVGVTSRPGEDEQSGASVGGTGVGRSYSRPLRIEPERGKVTKDGVKSQSQVSCDVLQDDESRS